MTVERDGSLDVARGLAIVAIVLGHCLRGLESAGFVASTAPEYVSLDRALYMVHLSVFAFCAGLMVSHSAQKTGVTTYARRRITDFLWLYLVWSLLQGGIAYALGGAVNSPRSLASVFEVWVPQSQLWFFPWLALMTAVACVLQPWKSRRRSWLTFGLSMVVSVLSWGYFGPFVFTQGLGLMVIYFAGVILSFRGYEILRQRVPQWILAIIGVVGFTVCVALLCLTPAIPPTSAAPDRNASEIVLGIVCSAAGLCFTMILSMWIDRFRFVRRLWRILGRESLVIFLAHTLASAATRMVLQQVGIEDLFIQLVLGTLVGVFGPVLLWIGTRRWLPWVYAAPHFLQVGKVSRR